MSLKIVIIDKVPAYLNTLENMVRQAGYGKVVKSRSAKEAMGIIEQDSDIGLAIVEWDLPEVSGLDFLGLLRSNDTLNKMPVMLTFKEKSRDEIINAIRCGAKGFLVKPFNYEVFRQKILEVVPADSFISEPEKERTL
jgi:two-component system, chemotaxis family, chemotaxis protein CheY